MAESGQAIEQLGATHLDLAGQHALHPDMSENVSVRRMNTEHATVFQAHTVVCKLVQSSEHANAQSGESENTKGGNHGNAQGGVHASATRVCFAMQF